MSGVVDPLLPPRRLTRGSTVAVFSPSSPVAARCPRRFGRGVAELERHGFRVRVGAHAQSDTGYTAGTPEERVADLHALFADDEVRAIVCTIGGWNSNQLLDLVDYDLVRANPKIVVGFSDATALLVALRHRTGLVTFLGPALLPDWGEPGGLDEFTRTSFEATVMSAEPAGQLGVSSQWTDEMLRWDEADDRPRVTAANPGPYAIRPGSARGRILAGNLGTLLHLAGTTYWPEFDDVILCLEDDEEEDPGSIDRYMTHLRHTGALSRIAALVVGRFPTSVGLPRDVLTEIVLRCAGDSSFPIAADFDFGHTQPVLTLPNGVEAEVVAGDSETSLALLQPAVR